ncbi:hypothetical protein LEP1GSC128_2466 [Leptospira borgpetersenii str. 200801926]|uniref:Uncharacterized protein n=1 Tax=Leptospira borgpetersenii str. 200801926 TaxID=1193009 RepID=A0ABP2S4T2_LEPBO|nr:hypothetical protein LEP1GSC128_2466 [Leptospira borgpetersenii str. 200801926]
MSVQRTEGGGQKTENGQRYDKGYIEGKDRKKTDDLRFKRKTVSKIWNILVSLMQFSFLSPRAAF